MSVYPIVVDAPFGFGLEDQEKIMNQEWFASFSDFFGSPTVWVDTRHYFKAYKFIELLHYDILCV